eukprot:COSAG02_NODE_1028_length_15086_cov_21.563555_8_plen_75_part_00
MAAVNARQDHLRYLAGAAARMGGDCNPNMQAYLSPAAVGKSALICRFGDPETNLFAWFVLNRAPEPVVCSSVVR